MIVKPIYEPSAGLYLLNNADWSGGSFFVKNLSVDFGWNHGLYDIGVGFDKTVGLVCAVYMVGVGGIIGNLVTELTADSPTVQRSSFFYDGTYEVAISINNVGAGDTDRAMVWWFQKN